MKVYTTGQVAKFCRVAPRTVSKWFDSGRLKGYRIPGSQDRRIPHEYLVKFFKETGMPLGEWADEGRAKVLVVAQDEVLIGILTEAMPPKQSFKVTTAPNAFDAGIAVESSHPDCIAIDFSIGESDARQLCESLRKSEDLAEVLIFAFVPDDGNEMNLGPGITVFKKPFDAAAVAEQVKKLVGAKKELV